MLGRLRSRGKGEKSIKNVWLLIESAEGLSRVRRKDKGFVDKC